MGVKQSQSALDFILLCGKMFPAFVTNIKMDDDALPELTATVYPGGKGLYDNLIQDVVYNGPATIVFWSDGMKTVVKCQDGDTYSKELGLAMCIAKRFFGNTGLFNDIFKKWAWDESSGENEVL